MPLPKLPNIVLTQLPVSTVCEDVWSGGVARSHVQQNPLKRKRCVAEEHAFIVNAHIFCIQKDTNAMSTASLAAKKKNGV